MSNTRSKFINWQALLFPLTILVALVYLPLNQPHGVLHSVKIPLDSHLPFLPIFAIPYILVLVLFWGTLLYAFWANKKFKPLALSIIAVHLISYLFYFFFQTHVSRPVVLQHGILNSLVRLVYSHDQPYNDFPSLHVAMATILAMYYYYIKYRWRIEVAVFCLLVILSTLFIKQHYIADVVGSLVLSVLVTYVCFKKFSAL